VRNGWPWSVLRILKKGGFKSPHFQSHEIYKGLPFFPGFCRIFKHCKKRIRSAEFSVKLRVLKETFSAP
jgi:hypothetical protein